MSRHPPPQDIRPSLQDGLIGPFGGFESQTTVPRDQIAHRSVLVIGGTLVVGATNTSRISRCYGIEA